MRAILINTVDQAVTEIQPEMVNGSIPLKSFYSVLDCDCIDIVRIGDGVDMVIDDSR